MAKVREGWKVTHRDGRSLYASVGAVRYVLGRWVKPKKGFGPLCVFTNSSDAQMVSEVSSGTLHKCLYVPSRAKSVWELLGGRRFRASVRSLTSGTALAKKVKILERI